MPERIGLVAELDLRDFDRAVNSYIRSVNRMERATHNVADSMIVAYARLGGVITTTVGGITAAIGGLAALSAKEGFDWLSAGVDDAAAFEQQMADIGAVLVKTREEVEPLAQLINSMALDPLFVVSTEEAGAVVEQLSRNGIEMTDILNGAARAAILLANSTGGDFAMAADVATMAMQMFNMKAEDMNRIADVSQGVINNTRIELDDWKLALGNGGAVAASAGLTIEDFAATIQSTINSFHSARQAGTSLMNFVQRLVPITKTAAEEFRSLGLFTGLSDEEFAKVSEEIAATEQRIADLDPRLVHYDELVQAHTKHAADLRQELVAGKNAFFDEQGNMKKWSEVVDLLIEKTAHLSQEERTEAFRRMFGNDAMETALALTRMGVGELEALRMVYEEVGVAEAAAITRTDTLAKRWENLGDIWEAIRRKSGEKFISMLRNFVERLTTLTNQNQDRVIEFFGRMAELLNRIVDAAMPWVERMLPVLIDNIEALASWLVELALSGDRAEEWFAKMHPALQGFITRIIDMVAAGRRFVRWIIDVAGAIRDILRPFTDWIAENVSLEDGLIAAAGAVAVFLAPLAVLIARMAAAGLAAAQAVAWIRKAWAEDFAHIRTIFTQVWPKIEQPLYRFINNFLMGRWVEAWNDAVGVVVTVLDDISRYTPDFITPFLQFITNVLQGEWGQAFDNMVLGARNAFRAIRVALDTLNHPFTEFITRLMEGEWLQAWYIFQRTAVNVLNFLESRLPVFFKPFASFIANVLEGDWQNAWNDAQQIALNVYDAIVAGLDMINTPFTRFLSNLLKGEWADAWEQAKNFAIGIFNRLIEELRGLDTPFSNFIADVLEGNWVEAWETIKDAARAAYDWIIDQLYTMNTPLSNFLGNVLTGQWEAVWEDVKDAAEFAYNWIVDKLYEIDTPISNFLGNILTGKWNLVWADIKKAAELAYDWIVDKLYEIGTPLTNFLGNVLTGKWNLAWQQIQKTAETVLLWIRDRVAAWAKPLFDALINVINGDWSKAWANARLFAIEALEEVREFFGGGFISDIIDILVNIIEGDWQGAWYMARSVAIDALSWIRDRILPDILDPIANMLISLINGDWARAWSDAVTFVMGVRDWIVEWLDTFDSPFTSFFARILQGQWRAAWEEARQAAVIVRDFIVDWLDNFDNPFVNFISRVLQGQWRLAWEEAQNAVRLVRDFIVDWLDNFDNPFVNFISNVLQGQWRPAWEEAQNAVRLVRDFIVDWLDNFDNPFANFISNVLQGQWRPAWEEAQNAVRLVRDFITDWLDTLDQPFATFISNILKGEWLTAWGQAQRAATDALEGIKNYLPEWSHPFITAIQDMVNGEWAAAWNEARMGVTRILDTLKASLPEWFQPFISAIQQVINGEWSAAWDSARTGIILSLEELKNHTPDWFDPFLSSIQAVITGDWDKVWDEARRGITLALDKIKEDMPGWGGRFITLIQQLLNGEWKAAWETASGLATDALKPIGEWITSQGQVVYDWFYSKMPLSTTAAVDGFNRVKEAWDDFVAAATNSDTQINLDNLGAVVIKGITTALEMLLQAGTAIILFFQGDWKGGWEKAGEALTTFGELPVISVITTWFSTTFPNAADSFMEKMPAIETAWEPVAQKWPETWQTIANWWDNTVKPFFDRTFVSLGDYFGTTLEQFGIFLQGIEELITGEGSFRERLDSALEIMRGITDAEIEFWKRDAERSGNDFTAIAKIFGENTVKGFDEGLNPGAGGGGFGAIEEFSTGVTTAMEQNTPELEASGKGAGEDVSSGFAMGLTESLETTVRPGIVNWLQGIQGAMTEQQSKMAEYAKTLAAQTNIGFVQGLADPNSPIASGLNAWTDAMVDQVNENLDVQSPSGVFEEIARFTVEGFRNGVVNNIQITLDAAASLTQQFIEKFNVILSDIPPIAHNTLSKFRDVFRDNMHIAIDITRQMVEQILETMRGLVEGARNIIGEMINVIRDAASSSALTDLGSQIGQGLVSGLESKLSAVQTAASALVTAAEGGVVEEAEIASPSKLFEELGYLSGEGYVQGWQRQLQVVESLMVEHLQAMRQIMQENILSFKETVHDLQEAMADTSKQNRILLFREAFGNDGLEDALSKARMHDVEQASRPSTTFSSAVQAASVVSNSIAKTTKDFVEALKSMLYPKQTGFSDRTWSQFAAGLSQFLSGAGSSLTTTDLRSVLDVLRQDLVRTNQQQLAQATSYKQATGKDYPMMSQQSTSFGPIYINNEMDGAELLYRVQQIIDSRRPV